MPYDIETLELSNSCLNDRPYKVTHTKNADPEPTALLTFCDWIIDNYEAGSLRLKVLNISHNRLSDIGCNQIMNTLNPLNKILRELNLSRNNLSDQSSESISIFLDDSKSLVILNLNWNQFSAIGAMIIFQVKNHELYYFTDSSTIPLSDNLFSIKIIYFIRAFQVASYDISTFHITHWEVTMNSISQGLALIIFGTLT